MADNSISFKISSTFSGDGFNAANQALQQNKREINAVRTGLGELTNAFSAISPEASTATNAVGQFAKAFTTGGIVGGIITLALKGVAEAVKLCGEKIQEAKERSEQWAEMLKNKFVTATSTAKDNVSKLNTELHDFIEDANEAVEILKGANAQKIQTKVLQLHSDTLNALIDAESEEERELIAAQEAIEAAYIKSEATIEMYDEQCKIYGDMLYQAKTKHEEAENELVKANNAYIEVQNTCKEYLTKRNNLLNSLDSVENGYYSETHTLQECIRERKNLNLALKELETTYSSDIKKLDTAQNNVKSAQEAVKSFLDAQKTALQKLNTAYANKNNAILEAEVTEKELSMKEESAQEALDQLMLSWIDEETAAEGLTTATDEAASGMSDLGSAAHTLAGKLNDYDPSNLNNNEGNNNNEQDSVNVKVVNPKDFPGASAASSIAVENQFFGKPKKLDDATWSRYKEGTASVADIQRVKRFEEMDRRYKMNEFNRVMTDAVRWCSMLDKPKSWLSERDKNFQDVFKQEILSKLPKDVATKLLGDASKKVLIRDDLKDFLGSESKMVNVLTALKEKVNLTKIESAIGKQTTALQGCLKLK